MKHYVLGFLFNNDRDKVVVIRKNRPEWQAGKYNGIGGKVEPGEYAHAAMIREFKEETGLEVRDWKHRMVLQANQHFVIRSVIDIFTAEVDCETMYKVRSVTDEGVRIVQLPEILGPLAKYVTIPNLQWIIPLLLDKEMDGFHIMEQAA